jgi:DNA-binding protein HU-beta
MTKQQLANRLAGETGLSRIDALRAVEGLMTVMGDTFVEGHNIYLRGFGTFKVRTTKQKTARNISRGETVIVPPRKTVKFVPCENLKKRLHNNA